MTYLDTLDPGQPDDLEALLQAIEWVESRGRRNAVGPLLPTGDRAQGSMQVRDSTALRPGFDVTPGDPANPDDVRRVGRDYAKALMGRFGLIGGLSAYNAGPTRYQRATAGLDAPLPQAVDAYLSGVENRVRQIKSGQASDPASVSRETQPRMLSLDDITPQEAATELARRRAAQAPTVDQIDPEDAFAEVNRRRDARNQINMLRPQVAPRTPLAIPDQIFTEDTTVYDPMTGLPVGQGAKSDVRTPDLQAPQAVLPKKLRLLDYAGLPDLDAPGATKPVVRAPTLIDPNDPLFSDSVDDQMAARRGEDPTHTLGQDLPAGLLRGGVGRFTGLLRQIAASPTFGASIGPGGSAGDEILREAREDLATYQGDPRENPAWKLAEEAEARAARLRPINPQSQKRDAYKAAEAIGQLGAQVATAPLLGEAGVAFDAIRQQAGQQAQDAAEAGATADQIRKATDLGAAPGALDVAGIESILNPVMRAAPGLRHRLAAMIANGIRTGAIEGTTEGIQQIGQNAVARVVGYDSTRPLDEGTRDAILMGAVAGGAAGTAGGARAHVREAPTVTATLPDGTTAKTTMEGENVPAPQPEPTPAPTTDTAAARAEPVAGEEQVPVAPASDVTQPGTSATAPSPGENHALAGPAAEETGTRPLSSAPASFDFDEGERVRITRDGATVEGTVNGTYYEPRKGGAVPAVEITTDDGKIVMAPADQAQIERLEPAAPATVPEAPQAAPNAPVMSIPVAEEAKPGAPQEITETPRPHKPVAPDSSAEEITPEAAAVVAPSPAAAEPTPSVPREAPSEAQAGMAARTMPLGVGLVGVELSPQGRKAADVAEQTVRKILPNAPVQLFEKIRDAQGNEAHGALVRGVLALAARSPNVGNTARHEVIHLLREQGLITPDEWTALESNADQWVKDHDIEGRYAGDNLTPEQLREEAIAEQYAQWGAGKLQPQGAVKRGLLAIKRFAETVRRAVRQAFGREPDWRDFFTQIERGKIGAREAQPQGVGRVEVARQPVLRAVDQARSIDDLRPALAEAHPDVEHWVSESVRGGRPVVTLSKMVVPERQRGQGKGSAFLDDLTRYADRKGAALAISPSTAFGGNMAGLRRLYDAYGFERNAGKNRDDSISESMVRQPGPPPAAPTRRRDDPKMQRGDTPVELAQSEIDKLLDRDAPVNDVRPALDARDAAILQGEVLPDPVEQQHAVSAAINSEIGRVLGMDGPAPEVPLLEPVQLQRPMGTPEQEKALNKAIYEDNRTFPQRFVDGVRDTLDQFRSDWVGALADDLRPIKSTAKLAAGNDRLLDREIPSYVAAVMTRHTAGQIQAFLLHGQPVWDPGAGTNLGIGMTRVKPGTKGLYDVLAPLYRKGTDRLFEGYAYARRVQSQNLLFEDKANGIEKRERNLSQDDVDELLKLEQTNPEFKQAFDELQDWKKSFVDYAEALGLINADQRATWEQMDHVPFYRVAEDVLGRKRSKEKVGKSGTGPNTRRGLANQSANIKRLTGGEQYFGVVDPTSGKVYDRYLDRGDAVREANRRKQRGKAADVAEMGAPVPGIIQNVLQNSMQLLDASLKNHAANLAVADGLQAGLVEKVPLALERSILSGNEILRVLENAGVNSAAVERDAMRARAQGLHIQGADRMSYAQLKQALRNAGVDPVGLDPVHTVATLAPPTRQPGVFAIRVNGKPQYYRVHDPLLWQALTSIHRSALSPEVQAAISPLTWAKSFFTRTITSSPDFLAANVIRDSIASWSQTDVRGFNAPVEFARTMKGAVDGLVGHEDLRRIMAAGFDTGHYQTHPEQAPRALKERAEAQGLLGYLTHPRAWLESYEKLGRASELANRLAIERAARTKGLDEVQAAFESADILDFQRRGSAPLVQFMTAITPFLNARIQGLYRLGRTPGANPWKIGGHVAARGALAASQFLLKGSMLASLSLALAALNLGDDDYNALPEWEKDAYYMVPLHHVLGKETAAALHGALGVQADAKGGTWLKIPKPFEIGILFGTVPERFMQLAHGDDRLKDTVNSFAHAGLDTLNFNPMGNPILNSLVEQYANRVTFTGAPIVPKRYQDLQPDAQYELGHTSDTTRKLAEVLPKEVLGYDVRQSPMRMEALTKSMGGTIGMYLLAASDLAVRKAEGQRATPDLRPDQAPVLRRFLKLPDSSGSKWEERFYDMKQSVDELAKTIKKYGDEGNAGRMILETERGGAKTSPALKSSLDSTAKQLGTLNKARRAVQMSPDMSSREKREQIDQLNRSKRDLTSMTRDLERLLENQ